MKLTQKLCGTALLSVVGLGLALPTVVNAAPESHTGDATIKFKEDDGEDIVTPPGTDGPEIEEPTPNPDAGPLKIIAISSLKFGEHSITAASNGGWEYYAQTAKAVAKVNEDNPLELPEAVRSNRDNLIEMPNFVTFKDTRADDLPNTHTVSAKVTTPFTNEAQSVLTGASLTFSNIELGTTGDAATQLNPSAIVAPTRELLTDGTPTTFIEQKDDSKGFGKFDLTFGTVGENGTADKSVKLSIPAANNKLSTKSEYKAVVTWTIASAR
ncbi:hypothetical protein BCR22_05315 [Enterococcus plantarum]|uniref:WxL domain-containing protein n=1 Tax=Enterococcus TaxID=1350 RepID=UPI00084D8A84|nr:WxL domain-containing protein [Enterococcus plantarum]MBO0421309.1 WxL domain-containing protein [Enterococcus plantarum]OEG11144.1 hypothetical protein BCR22_05315 [Enterococcus plantarum]